MGPGITQKPEFVKPNSAVDSRTEVAPISDSVSVPDTTPDSAPESVEVQPFDSASNQHSSNKSEFVASVDVVRDEMASRPYVQKDLEGGGRVSNFVFLDDMPPLPQDFGSLEEMPDLVTLEEDLPPVPDDVPLEDDLLPEEVVLEEEMDEGQRKDLRRFVMDIHRILAEISLAKGSLPESVRAELDSAKSNLEEAADLLSKTRRCRKATLENREETAALAAETFRS